MTFRPRVIPVLLLRGNGLVKTRVFDDARYLGDPVNVVRIFNDKGVDELVLLDIEANRTGHPTDVGILEEIASEAFVPVASGGGINTLDGIAARLDLGFEKAVVNSAAVEQPGFVRDATREFGSSTIAVCIDVKKRRFGRQEVVVGGGSRWSGLDPVEHARAMADQGVGELIVQSVDLDGTMQGYDLDLIGRVAAAVDIPVVALGGAGTVEHLGGAVAHGAAAAGAGSMFVFQGKHNAVLISYPTDDDLTAAFGAARSGQPNSDA